MAALGGESADAKLSADVMAEFKAADVIVLGVPMYNFTIPSQLKAWIDRILIAGQTFRYTETGSVEGLAGGKRVIIGLSRGGYYGKDTPMAGFNHQDTYLQNAFTFIGIGDVETVEAEGVAVGPEAKTQGMSHAHDTIEGLVA